MGCKLEQVQVILEGSEQLKGEILKNAFQNFESQKNENGNDYKIRIIKIDGKKVEVIIHSGFSITSPELDNSKDENFAVIYICDIDDKNQIESIKNKRKAIKDFQNVEEAIIFYKGNFDEKEPNDNDLEKFANEIRVPFYHVKNDTLDNFLIVVLRNCLSKANDGKRSCC